MPIVPVVKLFGYQQRWMDDRCRLKLINKGRQIGISFAETLDIVMHLLAVRETWYYLHISEERAAEAIQYAARHLLALGLMPALREDYVLFEADRTRFRRLTLTLPNGSKLIGLPANARTARGCTGNVTLDEFAHHLDADDIWKAIVPVITWGYRLHVISTPNGMQGRYYRLWTDNGRVDPEVIAVGCSDGRDVVGDRWSRHRVDIYQAKAEGHPIDIAEARALAGDEETWQQEYCCAFLDEAHAWLPFGLIDKQTSREATLVWDADAQKPAGPLYAGYDVARKRDLSVLWINEQRQERIVTRAVIALRQSAFADQERFLNERMPKINRLCVDTNGIGAQLGEDLQRGWGEHLVECVDLTGKRPAMLASKVKRVFEDGALCIPDCPDVRRDLHSVRRTHTDMGNVRFEAPRTKDGHADRFWALALALEAGDTGYVGVAGMKTGSTYRYQRAARDWGSY